MRKFAIQKRSCGQRSVRPTRPLSDRRSQEINALAIPDLRNGIARQAQLKSIVENSAKVHQLKRVQGWMDTAMEAGKEGRVAQLFPRKPGLGQKVELDRLNQKAPNRSPIDEEKLLTEGIRKFCEEKVVPMSIARFDNSHLGERLAEKLLFYSRGEDHKKGDKVHFGEDGQKFFGRTGTYDKMGINFRNALKSTRLIKEGENEKIAKYAFKKRINQFHKQQLVNFLTRLIREEISESAAKNLLNWSRSEDGVPQIESVAKNIRLHLDLPSSGGQFFGPGIEEFLAMHKSEFVAEFRRSQVSWIKEFAQQEEDADELNADLAIWRLLSKKENKFARGLEFAGNSGFQVASAGKVLNELKSQAQIERDDLQIDAEGKYPFLTNIGEYGAPLEGLVSAGQAVASFRSGGGIENLLGFGQGVGDMIGTGVEAFLKKGREEGNGNYDFGEKIQNAANLANTAFAGIKGILKTKDFVEAENWEDRTEVAAGGLEEIHTAADYYTENLFSDKHTLGYLPGFGVAWKFARALAAGSRAIKASKRKKRMLARRERLGKEVNLRNGSPVDIQKEAEEEGDLIAVRSEFEAMRGRSAWKVRGLEANFDLAERDFSQAQEKVRSKKKGKGKDKAMNDRAGKEQKMMAYAKRLVRMKNKLLVTKAAIKRINDRLKMMKASGLKTSYKLANALVVQQGEILSSERDKSLRAAMQAASLITRLVAPGVGTIVHATFAILESGYDIVKGGLNYIGEVKARNRTRKIAFEIQEGGKGKPEQIDSMIDKEKGSIRKGNAAKASKSDHLKLLMIRQIAEIDVAQPDHIRFVYEMLKDAGFPESTFLKWKKSKPTARQVEQAVDRVVG